MSYPSDPSNTSPPPPPAPGKPPSAMPLWLPVAAGIAVVAVAAVIVATVAGGDSKSGTTTAASTSTTTPATTTTAGTTTVPSTTTTTLPQPQAGGSWTVLVYGLGDNNLEEDLLIDLQEMAAVPAADLSFVALVDRTPDYTDAALPGIGDWEGVKLLTIGPAGFTEEADLGELNLGDPAVLTDFVTRGITGHPADHYALILWDHGSIAGVGSDQSHGDALSLPEIGAGVRAGLDAAGVDRLDIIGFDACLMGAYEVLAQVAPVAAYMIASEELEPASGWDYSAFDLLAAQPDQVTARSLGEEIVRRYVATSGPNDPTVTLSLVDLDLADEFIAAIDGFRTAVTPEMDSLAPVIGRGRTAAPSFGGSPLPEEDFFMVDVGVFLQNLAEAEAPLGTAAADALAVYDELVLASGAGEAASQATGLAIHFPPYLDWYWENWYLSAEPPVWPEFLDAYYAAGQEIPADKRPSFAPVDNQASYYFDDYGLTVEATFNEAAVDNIVDAVLYTGLVGDDGTITFIGEDQGLFEGSQALGTNDLTVLILDDGEDQARAYQAISFSEDLNTFILDVPLAYYPPPITTDYQDVILHLTYNLSTGELTEGFYLVDESGTIGEFQADPDGLIVPKMLEWRADGSYEWVYTSDIGLWADLPNLMYDFQELDPGTEVYAELTVWDFGGNSDYASIQAVVPAGEGAWEACSNPAVGFQIEYPADWFLWQPPSPDLDCAYFDLASLEGLDAEEAFQQAALTVEALAGADVDEALSYLGEYAVTQEQTQVAGVTATVYQSALGEWGFRAFVVPLGPTDADGALVIARWGPVDQSLIDMADRVAASLVLTG